MKKELAIKQISPLIKQAGELFITDNLSLERATDFLSKVNKTLDLLIEDKERLTKPLNQSLKAIRNKYQPLQSMLEEAIKTIRNKMSVYATQVETEKQKIAERIKEGKGNLSVEKGIEKIEAISVPSVISTDNGSLQFRSQDTLNIKNPDDITREYLIPDEAKILADLKLGKVVAGCEILQVMIPINKRN